MTIQESGPTADYGLSQRNLDAFMKKAQYVLSLGISEDVYVDEWRKVLDSTYDPPTEAGHYYDRDGEVWEVNAAGLYQYDPDYPQTGPVGRLASAVTESAPFFPVDRTDEVDAAIELISNREGDYMAQAEWLAELARKAIAAGF